MAQKVPVTVVTGFLGAGKTSLIRHWLENAGGRRIAGWISLASPLCLNGRLEPLVEALDLAMKTVSVGGPFLCETSWIRRVCARN